MTKNISLLGSTGSIGTQSLDVARLHQKFEGQAFPPFMQKIIDCEGLVNYINQK